MRNSLDEMSTPQEPNQDLFVAAWQVYRKMLDNNYLFHREAYGCLRTVLTDEVDAPFGFLDVACGDAVMSMSALRGTGVGRYDGMDLSAQALAIAAENVRQLTCVSALHHCDFSLALPEWKQPADVVWIGLSLHHFMAPAKLEIMRSIREVAGGSGRLLIYEDASPDGEDRDGWLARWDEQRPDWRAYSDAEWDDVNGHVHSSDFPETDSVWRRLGHEAGFSKVSELFESPTRLFRLYSFQA